MPKFDPRTEHQIQSAYFDRVRLHVKRYPELKLCHAIPNGGLRNLKVAVKLKREGVLAAIPDVHLPVPRLPYSGLYIEFKSRRPGGQKYYPSLEQKGMHQSLREWGHCVLVHWDDEEAWHDTLSYLKGCLTMGNM